MFGQGISAMLYQFLYVFLRVGESSSFPPPLDGAKERELFEKMHGGDQEARDALICHNLRLVAHIVKKYYGSAKNQEDLISIGTIGLIKAIDTFNSKNGARFATYAGKCLQNEILMHFRTGKKTACEVSVNETIDTDKDGNPLTYLDVICCEDTIADDLDLHMRSAAAKRMIAYGLEAREKKILILRYGLSGEPPCTQREISKKLGISRSYVSRIEKSALEKIRKELSQ